MKNIKELLTLFLIVTMVGCSSIKEDLPESSELEREETPLFSSQESTVNNLSAKLKHD